MGRRILLINGHPDPRPERLCAALADAYEAGAREAGHEVRRIDIGAQEFPLVRSAEAFAAAPSSPVAVRAQADLAWADHLVVVHPLWLGGAPAVLKGFLEQVFRYGFALSAGGAPKGLLTGRSVRMIVTMGMPAPVFRFGFDAAGLKALTRGVFWLSGMRPIRSTLIGGVGQGAQARWINVARGLGWRGG